VSSVADPDTDVDESEVLGMLPDADIVTAFVPSAL
jgi:hypothetical protein